MKTAQLIHSRATPQARRFLTQLVFGIWWIYILCDPLSDLASLPPAMFQVTGILTLPFVHGYLTVPVLWVLKISLLLFLAMAFLKVRFILSALASAVLLTLHQGLVRGFGHINHAEIVLLLAVYVLVLCAAADRWTERKGKGPDEFNADSVPFIGILLVMCLTYMFTGIRRLIWAGLEPFTSDTILYHILVNSLLNDTPRGEIYRLIVDNPLMSALLRVGFMVINIFEILAPFCLVSRKFRYAFVAVMAPFHILSWLLMHVFFWQTLALYFLFFDVSSRQPKGLFRIFIPVFR